MDVSSSVWIGLVTTIAVLIALDFVMVSRKPHDVLFKEAMLWSIFYIGVAVVFGAWVWKSYGSQFGTEYFAAYLVEKSLSIDNLFIFVIILTQFAVPSILHQRVLLIGVILALAFRAVFIAIGAAALHAFAFTFVIFGLILVWTGVSLYRHRDKEPHPEDNAVIRLVRRLMPITSGYHESKVFIRREGKRYGTPMLLVIIAIASTDLLFALDSIPATYGVTSEPLLVFAANAFALLGLRALYFLLKGLLDKLVYLSIGLAAILVFIGFKLMAIYFHEVNSSIPKIPTSTSLLVIVAILGIATLASVHKNRKSAQSESNV